MIYGNFLGCMVTFILSMSMINILLNQMVFACCYNLQDIGNITAVLYVNTIPFMSDKKMFELCNNINNEAIHINATTMKISRLEPSIEKWEQRTK